MKTRIRRMIAMLLVTIVVSGCQWTGSYDYSPYQHTFLEEETYLVPEDEHSPFCDFSIDYSCLKAGNDSILNLINQTVQREFLGEQYAELTPDAAIDSFKNDYLRQYREEVGSMYQADKAKDTIVQNMPAWYNRTYSLVTFVEEGRGDVFNATANYYEDMGGAHPMQASRWINLDGNTGRMLTKEDVFRSDAVKNIETLLLDKLLLEQAALYPDETLNTLEDLHAKGILQMTPMYIPDNFLMNKDKILFLFNRYDIAPYAAGEIVLELTYEEIGHCLIEKK